MLRHRPILVASQCIIISSELGILLLRCVCHRKCCPLIAMAINLLQSVVSCSIACFVLLHSIIVTFLLRCFVAMRCIIFVSTLCLSSSRCNG